MKKMFNDTNHNIYNYSQIAEYQLTDAKKSGGSAIARAGLGALALGPVGLLAGVTAKKKYSVLLVFKSGTKKMVTLDEENLKKLMENV